MKKLIIILLLSAMIFTCKAQYTDTVYTGGQIYVENITDTSQGYPADTTQMWFVLFPFTYNMDSSRNYIDSDKSYYKGYDIWTGGRDGKSIQTDKYYKEWDWNYYEFWRGESVEAHAHDHDSTGVKPKRILTGD